MSRLCQQVPLDSGPQSDRPRLVERFYQQRHSPAYLFGTWNLTRPNRSNSIHRHLSKLQIADLSRNSSLESTALGSFWRNFGWCSLSSNPKALTSENGRLPLWTTRVHPWAAILHQAARWLEQRHRYSKANFLSLLIIITMAPQICQRRRDSCYPSPSSFRRSRPSLDIVQPSLLETATAGLVSVCNWGACQTGDAHLHLQYSKISKHDSAAHTCVYSTMVLTHWIIKNVTV